MKTYLIAAFLALGLAGCALPPVNRDSSIPLGGVATIEPTRYAGLWYEIARYPNSFEENCFAVTAEYRQRQDGRLDVINICREGNVEGRERRALGRARIVDPETQAKLKVRFGLSPFEGDYWVLDRGVDYSWALVGEPGGRFLWILAREPAIADSLKADLVRRLQARGYNTEALYWTPQDATAGRARRTFAVEPETAQTP
ncbi:MAG: lipocalin family protein [Hyphomonadaceae bacterium]